MYARHYEFGRLALTRGNPVDCEIDYHLEPAADGTRLTLVLRYTNRRLRLVKQKLMAEAEEMVAAYKTRIEEETDAPRPT